MIPQLQLHLPTVKELLVLFLKNEISKIGLSKGVIGLSGGIDSALAAYLAAEALGPENVLCIMMPYKTSSASSITDAEAVISNLGVRSERVEITAMVDPIIDSDPEMEKVRRGNVMARMRMIVLYDRSAREKALVIGTGNKTEILLGYTTLFGDSACAINPIGDLYKTQVWALAEYLGIPEQIIHKPPSADLWNGQTDEDELGIQYRQADEILYFMIDERMTFDELTAKGFDSALIDKLVRLVQRNQFKRVPPLIAKVGSRTSNIDFRYARDWGV